LPPSEQVRLRKAAIKSLADQGVKQGFMLESVIKAEMLRMVTEHEGRTVSATY